MGWNIGNFVTQPELDAAQQQQITDEQYALDRYNSNPAYWEEQARLANPNFPSLMGEDFTNQYYTDLAKDLAGTEGMRAARLQGIAHDGGISQDLNDIGGDLDSFAKNVAGAGGMAGAGAALVLGGGQLLGTLGTMGGTAGATTAGAADVASAAGAMGGAAGTAGGGLTAFEAGGGLAGMTGAGGATAGLGSLTGEGGALVDAAGSGNPFGGTMWPDDSVMYGDPFGGSTMWPDDSTIYGDPYGGTMWPDDSVPGTGIPQNNNGTSWNQFGKWAMQNLAPNAAGPNWGDVGLGLMQYQGQRKFQDDIINTMNRAVDRADPFYNERPFYQNQFKQMNTDPNYFNNDAALNAMQNSSMRNVAAQNASKGYMHSGNILHDLHRTGTETAANYVLPRMDMSAKAAGAYNDPSRAGAIMSQMGQLAAGAGLAQNQTLGSTFRMASTGAQQGTLSNPIPALANWASQQNWSL